MPKRVLIVGSGAREHAIGWKIKEQNPQTELLFAPGNAGTSQLGINLPTTIRARHDIQRLSQTAKMAGVGLTIVGPEVPLMLGIVDLFRKEGLLTFGPTQEAARETEGSKFASKMNMFLAGVPTASIYGAFTSTYDLELFLSHYFSMEECKPVVIKADGLAAGKGVGVCTSFDEAIEFVRFLTSSFPQAAEKILIEEYLEGEELSVLAFVSGGSFATMVSARDYKRVNDGNTGPNTGGMGSYAPALSARDKLIRRVENEVLLPYISSLTRRGIYYTGVLYVGLMITPDGPKVLEFNCRFGDPEAQVILMLLESDLLEICDTIARGQRYAKPLKFRRGSGLCVVLASAGYPDKYETGAQILGLDRLKGREDVTVFHAGTKIEDGSVVTAGGRVLNICAYGKNLAQARERAYAAVKHISFGDMHFRRDVGERIS